MTFSHVRAADIAAGPGPHPAASRYDRRISEHLGLTAFEVYQVELPPGAETVRHDHLADGVEDMYAFVLGTGWLVVGDREVPVAAGEFVAVGQDEQRYVRAGDEGLVLIAVCGAGSAVGEA